MLPFPYGEHKNLDENPTRMQFCFLEIKVNISLCCHLFHSFYLLICFCYNNLHFSPVNFVSRKNSTLFCNVYVCEKIIFILIFPHADAMDQLEQRVNEFFMNAKKNKPEWREEQMTSIKKVRISQEWAAFVLLKEDNLRKKIVYNWVKS